MIIIAMIIQAFYDTFIRLLARCECAKHMHYERHKTALYLINMLQPSVGLLALGATAVRATPHQLHALETSSKHKTSFVLHLHAHKCLDGNPAHNAHVPYFHVMGSPSAKIGLNPCVCAPSHRAVPRVLPNHRCHFDRPEQGRQQQLGALDYLAADVGD
eukprot:5969580-Prymnesium_polylepis.2